MFDINKKSMVSLQQQARSWEIIFETLNKIDDTIFDQKKSGVKCAVDAIENMNAKIKEQQAQIDTLMFEYCPQDMTPEQLKNFEENVGRVWYVEVLEDNVVSYDTKYPKPPQAQKVYAKTQIAAFKKAIEIAYARKLKT